MPERLIFILTVLIITSSIFWYRHWYIASSSGWFLYGVGVFAVSMLILIRMNRPITLLIGWDGLGLSSYFLVVYYLNHKRREAGLITVLSNRVGDVFIMVLTSYLVINRGNQYITSIRVGIASLYLLSAITKRAMWPYCSWLPEAMAAPTPVSSLVHSSTLVTAGVWILYLNLEILPNISPYLCWFSSLTLLVASYRALFCIDLKKIVALSTLRQIAFIIIRLSNQAGRVAFFHLVTHALFKSCLFIGVGWVIHLGISNQDCRNKSISLLRGSEVAILTIPILSLAGLPPLAGFYSKDLIILRRLTSYTLSTYIIIICGAFITLIYSGRILGWIFSTRSSTRVISNFFNRVAVWITLGLFGRLMGGWYVFTLLETPFYNFNSFTAIALLTGMGAWAIFMCLSMWSHGQDSNGSSTFMYLKPLTSLSVARATLRGYSGFILFDKGWLEATLGEDIKKRLEVVNEKFISVIKSHFSLICALTVVVTRVILHIYGGERVGPNPIIYRIKYYFHSIYCVTTYFISETDGRYVHSESISRFVINHPLLLNPILA